MRTDQQSVSGVKRDPNGYAALMEEEQGAALSGSLAKSVEAGTVAFTDDQTFSIRDAFFDAELALLRQIAREAERLDGYESTRTLSSLVNALAGLRSMAGQSLGHGPPGPHGGWFGYSPMTGEIYDPEEDD